MQPNDQTSINTDQVYKLRPPHPTHGNGHFQPLLSPSAQVHCLASVLFATSSAVIM